MHTWPEIQTAGWVAHVFGLDPLMVLDSTSEDMEIRAACAQAVSERLERSSGG